MKFSREVVVTGTGAVTPLGVGTGTLMEKLLAGESGVTFREGSEELQAELRIAAPVLDFEAKKHVKPRKAIKLMCRPIQFGHAAAVMAFENAGLDQAGRKPDRIGTLYGTETFFADPMEVADVFRKCIHDEQYRHEFWGEYAMREIQPLWMLKYLPNMVASHVSIAVDARGPSNSICQGEASAILAIVEAADLIQRNIVDVMIVGGTGSQMALNAVMYRGVDLLSSRVGDPENACRPFDSERGGTVVGEGAGAIILESAEHASARNAKVHARIRGFSRTWCSPQSPRFAEVISANFQECLSTCGLGASDVSHINAHADGTDRDALEATAIRDCFATIPVVANKGNFGNLGPGSAMVETIAMIESLKSGQLPPNRNCDQVADDCGVNADSSAVNLGQPGESRAAIKSSISSTGQITALLAESV